MKCIIDNDVVLARQLEGPLSAHIAGFARWAREEGYAVLPRHRKVRLAACFSRWLGQKAISLRRVCSEHPARFLRSRARQVKIQQAEDRKSTRLNSSHRCISYAVFCLKKKKKTNKAQ